ncbi:hypothetical protein CAL14_01530 [Bordetella genomosp. 9]|nr:hypothetical protein CAL14_01530 [Bordetella genomosp. 9]
MLSRRVAVLFVVAIVSGCSSTKTTPGAPAPRATATGSKAASAVGDRCTWNRSKCIFEGSYEPGERDYAEQEAKRLNMAEIQRLRRSFGN